MAATNNTPVITQLGLDHIMVLLREVTPTISIADARSITTGTLFFSARHPVKVTANLFQADQRSEAMLDRIKIYKQSERSNWLWIFVVCPVDAMLHLEFHKNKRLEDLAAKAFRKSKAVHFGKMMSKFMDLNDVHCRIGHTIGYWLHKLYVAQGVPRSEFPECLEYAYREFLNWKGIQWSFLQPSLPFVHDLTDADAAVTPAAFPYALTETRIRSVPLPGLGMSNLDPDYQVTLRILEHQRKTEIFNEYINSGFDGTLVQFSDSFVFDAPTKSAEPDRKSQK